MARKMYHVAVSKASSLNSYHNPPPSGAHPFGPAMADWAFGINDYDDCDDYGCEEVYDEEYLKLPIEERWYQSEMELETVEQKASRLESEIKRFQRAYRQMAFAAMKWHYLQSDVEENSQIEKMFKDMQMMRKLSGSDNV